MAEEDARKMIKRKPVRFFLLAYGIATAVGAALLSWCLEWNGWVAWVASANVVALPLWGFDKLQARRGGWRVPELALHVAAAAGATPASLISMRLYRHKTLKLHFVVIYSILLVFQLALLFTFTGRPE